MIHNCRERYRLVRSGIGQVPEQQFRAPFTITASRKSPLVRRIRFRQLHIGFTGTRGPQRLVAPYERQSNLIFCPAVEAQILTPGAQHERGKRPTQLLLHLCVSFTQRA